MTFEQLLKCLDDCNSIICQIEPAIEEHDGQVGINYKTLLPMEEQLEASFESLRQKLNQYHNEHIQKNETS